MARLLVVDDDPSFREWLTLVLRRAHHTVFATATGEEALEIAGREQLHLAFIDIMLPGISGFDMLAALRQDKATADLPVILISSLGQRRFFRQGMELGADDFIAKPMSTGDVVKALDARLKRSGHVEPGDGDAGMPERVGDFEIGRRLAEGDLANTYLARHATSRREAIVRLTRATALDEAAVARFMREMGVAHALAHPHVAALLGYGVAQSRAYTVFEHFPQGTPAAMLSVPAPSALACRLAGQLASGLQALHDLDIVPGDLEPASIMLRDPGHALIGQYGMRSVTSVEGDRSSDGHLPGAPAYLAPEQIGGQEPGPRSDLYSLGIVLYWMLTGKVPFVGADYQAVLYKHLSAAPAPLPQACAALQPVIDRLLAKSPAERYGSAAEVGILLNAFAH